MPSSNPNEKFTKVLKSLLNMETSEQRKEFLIKQISKQVSNLADGKRKSLANKITSLINNKD